MDATEVESGRVVDSMESVVGDVFYPLSRSRSVRRKLDANESMATAKIKSGSVEESMVVRHDDDVGHGMDAARDDDVVHFTDVSMSLPSRMFPSAPSYS